VVLLDDGRVVVIALVWLLSSRSLWVVLLTFSRLLWWQPRKLVGALLELLDEAALTHGVGGFPARGAMELARLIKRCIKGVFVLSMPLTAAGSPQTSLVSRHSL
jgi:hypothetical protein